MEAGSDPIAAKSSVKAKTSSAVRVPVNRSDADTTPLQDVALDGATLTATFAFQGQSVRLTLTLTGDTFAGTADVGPLSLPISGTRRPN